MPERSKEVFKEKQLPDKHDYLVPDGSEIRLFSPSTHAQPSRGKR